MNDPILWAIGLVILAAVVIYFEWRDARAAEAKLRERPRVVDYMPTVPGCRECKLAKEAGAPILARHAVSQHGYPNA
jgi:deoxyinosine 3'endonuclease (endonuclease V)